MGARCGVCAKSLCRAVVRQPPDFMRFTLKYLRDCALWICLSACLPPGQDLAATEKLLGLDFGSPAFVDVG